MDFWVNWLGIGFWAIIIAVLLYSSNVFRKEKEARAATILIVLSCLLASLLMGAYILLPDSLRIFAGVAILTVSIPFLFRYESADEQSPKDRFDERDIMFSRFHLVRGAERFVQYYADKPDVLETDELIRKHPGLLQSGTLYYDEKLFSIARNHFEEIESLHALIDGNPASKVESLDSHEITNELKEMVIEFGAHSVGVTALKEDHLYSVKGRGDRYGEVIERRHSFAIAFTVEMDFDRVSAAPAAPIVVESSRQYLESGKMAIELAARIRAKGYEARAHIDGNYELICPLVARDAGLGEIGRMGLLMDPELGPRCRIAVVTTTMPLVSDSYTPDPSVLYFCEYCKKCADTCPGQAISSVERTGGDGCKRWKINQEKCFEFWCKAGTDCGRCMAVCPYSHPLCFPHNLVRWMIKKFPIYAKLAILMDHLFYGKFPKPKSYLGES